MSLLSMLMPLLLLSSFLHPLSLKGLSLSLPPSLLLLLQISTKFGCSYAFADQECFLHLVFPYSPKLVFLGSLGIVYFNSSSSDGVQNRPMIFVGTVRLNFTYFSVKMKSQDFSHSSFFSDFYFQSEFCVGLGAGVHLRSWGIQASISAPQHLLQPSATWCQLSPSSLQSFSGSSFPLFQLATKNTLMC